MVKFAVSILKKFLRYSVSACQFLYICMIDGASGFAPGYSQSACK